MTRTSKTPAGVRRARADLMRTLVKIISEDGHLLRLLGESAAPQSRSLLVSTLRTVVEAMGGQAATLLHAANSDLFSDLLNWTTKNRTSEAVAAAVSRYQADRTLNRKIHRHIVNRLGLNRASGRNWLAHARKYYLSRLDVPYPPLREHIVESDEIDSLWRRHLETGPQAEPRTQRHPLHRLDSDRLTLNVAADEDCILVDKDDGSIIAVVLREATESEGHAEFLGWAAEAIKDGITGRRSIRRDDPGLMIETGYTPGLRNRPLFAWVRNLERSTLSPDFLASSDYATSCLLAVGWNIFRSRFPEELMSDWLAFLRENQLPAMDGGVGTADLTGDYQIQYGDNIIVFHDAELAPGSGLLNWNYSRAIHFERQPHTYAVQWITERTHDESYGGHFYIASYGVRITLTADTMIAWRPADLHGTSLAAFSPHDPCPPYAQSGTCYTTSNRLGTVHQKYKKTFDAYSSRMDEPSGPPVKFGKRWTAADAAAEAAAEEFMAQIAAGVLEKME